MFKKIQPPVSIPSKYLSTIHFSGLTGRLLHLPPPKGSKKTFVVLSGQHAAHERMYAIARLINEYGEVYLPDLPGFGGMTSFYAIGRKPDWDNYADYLYTFLKTKGLKNDIHIFANSFSSQVMTRMFDKYPETQDWVAKPIALVGFAAGSNFNVSKIYKAFLYAMIYPVSTRFGSWLLTRLVFNRLCIHLMLTVFTRTKAKMQSDNVNLRGDMRQMEGYLWRVNDKRTHASTAITMFRDDLRKHNRSRLPLKLHNIITENDQYFDNSRVESAFKELYEGYETSSLNLHVHAPSMIAGKEDVRNMLSKETIKLLES